MIKFDLKHGPEWVDPGVCSIFPVAQGLGLLGDVVGGVIGSSAAKKAAKNAAATAQNNNALLKDVDNRNVANYGGYASRGDAAGSRINALLGLGGGGNAGAGQAGGGMPDYAAYVNANPDLLAAYNAQTGIARGRSMEDFGRLHYQQSGQAEGRQLPGASAPADVGSGGDSAQAQADAFKGFTDSTGYQFALKSGADAVSQNKIANGLMGSGSALKALQDRGTQVGNSYFGNYLAALQGQQNAGLQGASGIANSGSQYGAGVTGNNDSAASAQNASTIASANIWTNALQNAASTAGKAMGSSYGGGGGSSNALTGGYSGAGLQDTFSRLAARPFG